MALIVYATLVILLVGGMMGLSWILGERSRSPITDQPFESGVAVVSDARLRISAHFYLVAMFFVIFDLEAVYLFAWAVAAREAGPLGFFEALIFASLLLAALVYLWRIGALDWNRQKRGST